MTVVRVPVVRVLSRGEVEAVGLDGVSRKGVDTPVVPRLAVGKVEEGRPGVIGVELVGASDVGASVGEAL